MASRISDDFSASLPSFIDRRANSSLRVVENQHETAGNVSTTEKDWVHIVSLCCRLDIPIFNPPIMAIATRSSRSNKRSSIVRHVPTDLRGYNVVQKKCRVSHHPSGALQLDIATTLCELQILGHPALSKHENIIHLVGITWEEELPEYNLGLSLALLLDFAELGTLCDVLQQEQPLSFQEKLEVCSDIGMALTSLHECGIIHGDVKAENVLVRKRGDKWIAKLADFDLSLINPKKPRRLPGRTFPWNAPESEDLIDRCQCCLKLTDIYSFGMLIWRIFCDGRNPMETLVDILSLEEMETAKKNEDFVNKVLNCLHRVLLGVPDPEISKIRGAIENSLQYLPEKRNLKIALSYLQAIANSHIDDTICHQPLSASLDYLIDLDEIYIEHELMKYTDPIFNQNLVRCLENISLSDSNPRRRTQALLNLSITTFNGFGDCSDASAGIRLAIESAEGGCLESQALICRLHESINADVPQHLPVIEWLSNGVRSGSIIAAEDLRNISPGVYEEASRFLRTYNCGIGKPVFDETLFSIDDEGSGVERILNDRGDTIIHLAAVRGDPEWLLNLLSRRETQQIIDKTNYYHETPLLYACRCGHAEITRMLLTHGANAATTSYSGEGPLHWLSSFEEIQIPEIAKLLKDSNAGLEICAMKDMICYKHHGNGLEAGTPLLRAISRGSLTAVKVLLDIGASPIGETPKPLSRGEYYAGGDLVNTKGLRSHVLEKERKTCPFATACAQHRYEIVDLLLPKLQDRNIDLLNCNPEKSKSPTLWSSVSDKMVVRALNWFQQDYGDSDAFERLNAVFPHFTGLYFASFAESRFSRSITHGRLVHEAMTLTINQLVENGASLSCVNKFKSNALYAAVEGRNADIVSYLLQEYNECRSHINLTYEGCRGLRPIQHAIISNQKDTFDLLVERSAFVNAGLQSCGIANHRNPYYANRLLALGAEDDEDHATGFGDPLTLALMRGNINLATILVHQWPESLGRIPPKAMLAITPLGFTVVITITRSRPDYRSIRFLLEMHRQYGVRIGKPSNTDDGIVDDIICGAIAANWGQRNTEVMDGDRESTEVMQQVLRDLLMSMDMIDDLDLSKAVHLATQTRNVAALEVLLEFGADMNFITEFMGGKRMGWSTLDWALSTLKHDVPNRVKVVGKLACERYQKTSERIVEILVQGGALTAFDMKGHEIYGNRVGTFIASIITFKVYVDLFDDIWGAKEQYTEKLRRWTLRNARYL